MGRLNIPPTADPAENARKAPQTAGPGPEAKAAVAEAMESNIGAGSKKNSGVGNLGFDSGAIHGALK